METNLASILWNQASIRSDHCFINGQNGSYSYSQSKTIIANIAKALLSKGIGKGDKIIIVAPNTPETLFLFVACFCVGAIAVLLHEHTTRKTLLYIDNEVQPELICTDKDFQDLTEGIQRNVVLIGDLLDDTVEVKEFYPTPLPIDSPAFIIYTSGSTGIPKGVTLSHQNVLFVIKVIQKRLNYLEEDIIGIFIPLSFDYGLYQSFLTAQVGATLFLRDSSFAGPILPNLIQQHKISILPGLPNLFETLIKICQRRNIELASLRKFTNTGAHLPSKTIVELQKLAPEANVYPMYGLTECKRVSILLPDEAETKPGSCGRPLDDTQAWVVRPDGSCADHGESGELVVKGPHVSLGYWNSPEENKKRFRMNGNGDVLLFTGDLFTQDKDGFLYYVGRMDEQIKRNGYRISKLEIENVAVNLEGISNASLIQSSDKLTLFVAGGPTISTVGVLKEMEKYLERYKLPDVIRVVEEIKITKNGKVDERAMEALL